MFLILRFQSLSWAPTLVGYSVQGLFKFGLYEVRQLVIFVLLGLFTDSDFITTNSLASGISLSSLARRMPTSTVISCT